MSKLLSVSFVLLCGVSVLTASSAGFAVQFGEITELDDQWKGSTRTLSADVQELVRKEGSVEEKINELTKSVLKNISTITNLSNFDYEPAVGYLSSFADQIALWIYPDSEKERSILFKKILTDPTSIHPQNDWVICRTDFEQALKENNNLKAYHAVKDIYKLAQTDKAASTWIQYSWNKFGHLVDLYGDLDGNNDAVTVYHDKEEKVPAIDLTKQWVEARKQFVDHYKKDPEVAAKALEDLRELSKTVSAVQTWLEYSGEVLEFGEYESGSPFGKVKFHKDRQALQGQLKPILDELKKLVLNDDVHKLDKYYLENVENLVVISKAIFPENGKLTLDQTKTTLKKLIQEHPDLLAGYDYDKKTFKKEEVFNDIDNVYQNDMPFELCSHAFQLAIQLSNIEDNFGLYRLLDAIVENYETKGGCLEGRRNRQFGALAYMLAHCGL